MTIDYAPIDVPSDLEALQDSNELATQPWYVPDDRGLILHRVPTWEEWEEGLGGLAMLQHNLPKIIGDYVNIGEDTFGERYEQALDMFGQYAYGTIANYASICRSVPRERRHPELTMAHYKAVRTLNPDQQIAWQERAVENNWTTQELWDNIRGNNTTWFSRLDGLQDALAELQGQCHSDEAVSHITAALTELRLANYYEGEERNIFDQVHTNQPTGRIEAEAVG